MAVQTTDAPITLAPLMRWIETWREKTRRRREFRRTLAALSGLSDRDLADLGLVRSNIRDAAKRAIYG